MAGIKRTIGTHQTQKSALTIEHFSKIPFRVDLIGKRDKALLLVGFAGGLRRSELAGLRVEHLETVPLGIRIHLQRSKKNQEGKDESVDIVPASLFPYCCPVKSLEDWLRASGITTGPLFPSINRWEQLGRRLSTVSIGKIAKWAASCCGMDPEQFGGHSLRAGCATYLLDKGIALNVVAKHGRWKKYDSVLRYDRNATAKVLIGVY
ncbi:MAG: site-specific integrase, partial [SAR324 cluster bacterium]|nr:site-specific integrase [SAR324 cluster bacterium]